MDAGSTTCLLCGLVLLEDEKVTVTRGLDNLKMCSDLRNDGLRAFMENQTSIDVHKVCRQHYIDHRRIANAVSSSTSAPERRTRPILRSEKPTFNFRTHCLFCGDEADPAAELKKPKTRRRTISEVLSTVFQETVMEKIHERDDEWGREVHHRILCADVRAFDGRYHRICQLKFFTTSSDVSRGSAGRPVNPIHQAALSDLYQFLEENDECQYTINELLNKMKEFLPLNCVNISRQTLKSKLKSYFRSRIVISAIPGGNSILTFLDSSCNILNDQWYRDKACDSKSERQRIVETAAAIIREDICAARYDTDTYSGIEKTFEEAQKVVPETLQIFIEAVVMKKKRGSRDIWLRKCTSIEHAIISATRPRSFISMVQLSLSVYLHRHFGSRNLLDVLHALGMCASYTEANLYESSIVVSGKTTIADTAFTQFVFDNADFNSRTLDGSGTFHCMGGLQCVTPADAVESVSSISRLKTIPPASIVGEFGHIAVQQYCKSSNIGLREIQIENVSIVAVEPISVGNGKKLDCLWMCGAALKMQRQYGWSGFMDRATANSKTFQTTSVVPLPFINLAATDIRTIYTALMYAVARCKANRQAHCIVTFDQPLYWKAVDIVASPDPSTELSPVIVRLGGFHMLMSYMGSICTIMAGSGLEELWKTVYASNSVTQMITGHAYSRALRAHSLTQLALAIVVFNQLSNDNNEIDENEIRSTYNDILDNKISPEAAASSDAVSVVLEKLQSFMTATASTSRTAKLWKQYFDQVQIIRLFIRAERCGDWDLHMYCVQSMLPIFHAAGHIPYAKSTQLYFQQMCNAKSKMSVSDFAKFTNDGFFTVRRSQKVWAGVWTDMTIEQVLMRSMKTRGGVTRGRGLTESVLSRWILTTPASILLSDRFEEYCGIRAETSEQHVELRESRQFRDLCDVNKFVEWLSVRAPFSRERDQLISLSSGVIGDDSINCDRALECGLSAMAKMVGNNFGQVSLKRSDKVKSLATVSGGDKVHDEVVPVNTMQLFNRIICVVKSTDKLAECLKYELAPRPPSLFLDSTMRKPNKAALCKIFEKKVECPDTLPEGINSFIVDGGHLLHCVLWQMPATYNTICSLYVRYVIRHYGMNVTVVFDGYSEVMNTKAEEHRRRVEKATSADIVVEGGIAVSTTQAQFLGNSRNKSQLIDLLALDLREAGLSVVKANADADTLIVNTAISIGAEDISGNIVIVGNDTDLLVLMIALASPEREILMLKPGTAKVETKIYSSRTLQDALGDLYPHILFLHAMSGCDTTSALYGKGKKKYFSLMENDRTLQDVVNVFNQSYALPEDIAIAGEKFLLSLYGAEKEVHTLNEQRYFMYNRFIAKQGLSSQFQLSALPPTSAAARQHSFRVFHQVQMWCGVHLPETDWGWKLVCKTNLFPIPTLEQAGPESLLKLISCNCKSGCFKGCRCRKAGLKCTAMCGQCRGISCTNCANKMTLIHEDDDDILDDINIQWNDEGVAYTGMEVTIDPQIE